MKQNTQLEILKKHFAEGTQAHAYLFFCGGADEMKEAALSLAEIAVGKKINAANPDVFVIRAEEGSDAASIGQVWEIRRFLAFEPYFGKNKVVVIERADELGQAAQSALLKTLEEPPAQSMLILLADQLGLVLPTILSRVRKVRFPARAEGLDKKRNILYALSILIQSDIAERLAIVEKLSKDEASDGTEALSEWILFFRDFLCLAAGQDSLVAHEQLVPEMKKMLASARYTPSLIGNILSEMVRWEYALKTTNVNRRLALEHITLIL